MYTNTQKTSSLWLQAKTAAHAHQLSPAEVRFAQAAIRDHVGGNLMVTLSYDGPREDWAVDNLALAATLELSQSFQRLAPADDFTYRLRERFLTITDPASELDLVTTGHCLVRSARPRMPRSPRIGVFIGIAEITDPMTSFEKALIGACFSRLCGGGVTTVREASFRFAPEPSRHPVNQGELAGSLVAPAAH